MRSNLKPQASYLYQTTIAKKKKEEKEEKPQLPLSHDTLDNHEIELASSMLYLQDQGRIATTKRHGQHRRCLH